MKNIELSTKRRDVVLHRLRAEGVVTEESLKVALARPVKVMLTDDALTDAPYFVDFLLKEIEQGIGVVTPKGHESIRRSIPDRSRLPRRSYMKDS